jgi:DNA repair protein RecO (recombination protein O)
VLHHGRGELATITGAALVAAHDRVRTDPYRLRTGLIGLEAMLRLFTEQEANERAFTALTRFLDALDGVPAGSPGRPTLDPLGLAFQLKLLWLSGYLPHLESCVECGATDDLVGYLPAAGGAVCRSCDASSIPLSALGFRSVGALLRSPLAETATLALTPQAAREALAVVTASYEYHGGFRLRAASA